MPTLPPELASILLAFCPLFSCRVWKSAHVRFRSELKGPVSIKQIGHELFNAHLASGVSIHPSCILPSVLVSRLEECSCSLYRRHPGSGETNREQRTASDGIGR